MALLANFRSSTSAYTNAYIRVQRIWGSKEEGWFAWMGVFLKEGEKEPKEVFSVHAPYVEDENPFAALYNAAKELSFIEIPGAKPLVAEITTPVKVAKEEKQVEVKKQKKVKAAK